MAVNLDDERAWMRRMSENARARDAARRETETEHFQSEATIREVMDALLPCPDCGHSKHYSPWGFLFWCDLESCHCGVMPCPGCGVFRNPSTIDRARFESVCSLCGYRERVIALA